MQFSHDLSIWCRGGCCDHFDNQVRFIGLTRLGEMPLVSRPHRVFLAAVTSFDIIGRNDEQG